VKRNGGQTHQLNQRFPKGSPQLPMTPDELREKAFPNRVLGEMDQVIAGLTQGLGELSADAERIRSLTAWPWIVSLNLKAN